jgi:hypothetical protein
MRNTSSILCRMMVLSGLLFVDVSIAAPPRKPSASQFNILVSRSPFTIRSTSTGNQVLSPLEKEWMLGSIRPNAGGEGWSVTLIHKKDRKKRLRFLPGFSPAGYELLEVSQNTSEPKASSVKIRQGTQTASIKYDETLIRVRSAAASNGRSSGAKQPQPSKPRIIKSVSSKGIVQPTTPSKGGVVRPVRTRYTPKTTKP